jgi:carbonyl reductase 1
MSSTRTILVTGASAGIGLALSRQLLVENGCRVLMAVRSLEKGATALASLALEPHLASCATLIACDTSSDASVAAAVEAVRAALGTAQLYGIVNNAGVGLQPGVTREMLLATNYHGVVRVTAAFLPLLQQGGRIVNVGSGSGPTYVKALGETEAARELITPPSYAAIEAHIAAHQYAELSEKEQAVKLYGQSKACLHAYTQLFAKEHPEFLVTVCSPGFINTALTSGFGATKTPEEGTLAIKHCRE